MILAHPQRFKAVCVSLIYPLIPFPPCLAPRTPPENLISPSQTHNSISVQWDSIPFLDQNGPNFRYAVSYRVFGNGDASLNVTAETNTITIQNLMSLTTYSIVIRAQNDIGVGRPSNTIQARTLAARELHSSLFTVCSVQCVRTTTLLSTVKSHTVAFSTQHLDQFPISW